MSSCDDKDKCIVVKIEDNRCADKVDGISNMSSMCSSLILVVIIICIILRKELYSYVTNITSQ